MANEKQEMQISISDDVLKGTYSNNIIIMHTRGEFVLDCMTVFQPKGIIGARVIISPGHAKQLLKALQENISLVRLFEIIKKHAVGQEKIKAAAPSLSATPAKKSAPKKKK